MGSVFLIKRDAAKVREIAPPGQLNRYRAAETIGKELKMAAWSTRSLNGSAFSARLVADGSNQEVKMPILVGVRVKVYYIAKTRKVNEQKVKTN